MKESSDSVNWTSQQSKSTTDTQVVYDDAKVIVDQSNCKIDAPKVTVPMEIKPEGIKFDSDKLQWWYLWQFLPELEQVAYVLQYGDKKYPAEDGSNWKRLDNLERRASSAAMRHLSAYLQGNKQDNETDKSHLAHAITNLLFLMYNDRQNASSTNQPKE